MINENVVTFVFLHLKMQYDKGKCHHFSSYTITQDIDVVLDDTHFFFLNFRRDV